MEQPLVTLVLQTYNRCEMFKGALESARNQTYKNLEILIGDNHSEDGTEEYCLEQAKLDNRIKYFRHSENVGMVNNANFLLDRVMGEFFVFLNDDDWLELDYVEKCIEYYKNKPDYTLVCPRTVLYFKRDIYTNKINSKKCKISKLNSNSVFKRLKEYLFYQDALEMSTGCYRTSVLKGIKQAEGQYIINRYNEDIVLEMKFIVAGKCKMLANTHLNKREGGFSRDLTISENVYTTQDITMKNVLQKRCEIFSDAIANDKYFSVVLGEKNAKKLSKQIYFALQNRYWVGIFCFKKIYHKIKISLLILMHNRLYR